MRTAALGMLVFLTVVLAGCGGGTHFANRPRPASPVNVTVYLNDTKVSISPSKIGAGEVVFVVTNQSSSAQSLSILRAGGSASAPLATTGPISPQGTAQVTVNLTNPGDYSVAIGGNSSTEAAAATPSGIQPATLLVGKPRANSNNQLLQP